MSSASSEESFINKVKEQWGDEESELRQAIYFQFIKTVTVINDGETGSLISDLDKSIEEVQHQYGIVDENPYRKSERLPTVS